MAPSVERDDLVAQGLEEWDLEDEVLAVAGPAVQQEDRRPWPSEI